MNKKPRRLVLRDVNGEILGRDRLGYHHQIDLTGLLNANACFPILGVIEEQCNVGCWHQTDRFQLPLWGAD